MANISKIKLEYYQISSGEDWVAKLGSVGIRNYGRDRFEKETPRNHYHNLLEIGICRKGKGIIIFNKERIPYSEGTIIIVPANYPHNVVSTLGEKSFWEVIYVRSYSPSRTSIESIIVRRLRNATARIKSGFFL